MITVATLQIATKETVEAVVTEEITVATTESTGTRPETVFSTFFNKERSIFQI
jgi:hypothetical protein